MIFTLKSVIKNYEGINSLMHYVDERKRDILFKDSDNAFEYILVEGTHEEFKNNKTLSKVATAFVKKALKQHDFAGGYNEAIKTLNIKLTI